MGNIPRLNWGLFVGYILISLAVFVAALMAPGFRDLAYAPLRELILPPPSPIVVELLYSSEKEAWLNEVVPQFESTHPRIDGHPIQLQLKKMGSREIYMAILDGQAQPDLISPASSLQISILQQLSTSKFSQPIVNGADPRACRDTMTTPLVLVAWKERAEVLWGDYPPDDLWMHLQSALVNPQGWGAYGHPEWGYIKFGHTDPLKSNSGFQTLILMTYNYNRKIDGLTSADILNNVAYQRWFKDFEGTIGTFGESTGAYMQEMIAYGPSQYDIVAVYESSAIEQAANAVGRYGELQVYYPPVTLLSDHPFCVLKAPWVTSQKARAAQKFVDYLLGPEAQQAALAQGFRPVDTTIPLDQSGSPFQRYAANGLRVDLPAEVEIPSGDTLNTLLDFWMRNIP